MSESLSRSVPRDYELRSSKKGFSRYWSPYIKKMVGEMAQAEAVKESHLKGIMQDLIERFCKHHTMWRRLVTVVAELDALISLVIASDYYEGPTCRPSVSNTSNSSDAPHLIAESLGHPLLKSDTLSRGAFVPNDISIGGPDHSTFVLLTGPNMGGKSTLIRQICLAVILAQVGADVPAQHFKLSLVDRIFVRMGAKDHIMAGQSTFLTELSETASMLTSATRDSLVALDELGRGTSTSDGQAIAGHWMLLVFDDVERNQIYWFDSLGNSAPSNLRSLINSSLRIYGFDGGRRMSPQTPTWLKTLCARQKGQTECGYYVMRYMLEIVTRSNKKAPIEEVFKHRLPYSQEEVDEVRDLWADYFLNA